MRCDLFEKYSQLLQEDKLAFSVAIITFLFPLGMASIRSWAAIGFYLIVLLCLLALRRTKGEMIQGQKWLIWAILVFIASVFLSFINADDLANGYKRLGKVAPILLLIPVVSGLRRLPMLSIKAFMPGVVVGGGVMTAIALYSTMIQGKARAMGYYHPIIFGDLAIVIAAILTCLVLSGLLSGVYRWLVPAVIPFAIMASLLSQSRGGWFAIPAVAVLITVLHVSRFNKLKLLATILCFIAVIVLSPIIFPGTIGKQFDRTTQSIEQFTSGEKQNTSIGTRFLLWDIALQVWQEHPIIGSGIGDFRHDSQQYIDSEKTNLRRPWHHAHSVYFEYLSMTGLLGFTAMMFALLLAPFGIFYRYWRLSESPEEKFNSLSGMAIVLCFAVFGLSEAWLARSAFVSSYLLMLGIFLSSIGRSGSTECLKG